MEAEGVWRKGGKLEVARFYELGKEKKERGCISLHAQLLACDRVRSYRGAQKPRIGRMELHPTETQ